jgi:hypothetical protein
MPVPRWTAPIVLGLLLAGVALIGVFGTRDEPPAGGGVALSREAYGSEWPFTVDSGTVDCAPPNSAIFRVGETTYQLNRVARDSGYTSIHSIWRDDPDSPGQKVSVTALIDLALQQCGKQ